jgi:hypothetical protein
MRGSPLLRAALTFLVLLCLAPLLSQLTRPPASATVPAAPAADKGPGKIHLELAFTTPPKRVSISHLKKVVWSKDNPDAEEECDLELPWPKEGGELAFHLEWPDGANLCGMRARLTDPDDNKIERSLFGRGLVEEKVLNFP